MQLAKRPAGPRSAGAPLGQILGHQDAVVARQVVVSVDLVGYGDGNGREVCGGRVSLVTVPNSDLQGCVHLGSLGGINDQRGVV